MAKEIQVETAKPGSDRPNRRSTDQIKRPNYEFRVGLFATIATIFLLYGWTWLKSFSILHPPQMIQVQFHDIAGLTKNATVNVNGVRVGTVDDIGLKGKGQVLLRLKIKTEEITVPKGSKFTIQTLGLVGAKYVEISLPDMVEGENPPPPIEADELCIGQDPVRVELIMNKIATNINDVIGEGKDATASRDGLKTALRESGEAMTNIREAASKMNKSLDGVADAVTSIKETSHRFGVTADHYGHTAANVDRFFSKGDEAASEVAALARDLRKTSGNLNKMMSNPNSMGELRETVRMAQETANTIKSAMADLNTTLKDEPLRQNIITILDKINTSTKDIAASVNSVEKITGDKTLRSDVKEAVGNLKDAMSKLDVVLGDPNFKTDLKTTMLKVNSAATNIDVAAKQMNQIMGKRAPLIHMIFGRPGKVKVEKETVTEKKSDTDGDDNLENTRIRIKETTKEE